MVREERIESRVRGGYMNRWLIRKVTTVRRPYAVVAQDHLFGGQAIYAHPDLITSMRANA